jgi:DNA mismatch repair protein MutL
MISLPPKIDLLPEHLIDQIKAGEVIERPGSLLKEILENSVDAGATKIELVIRNNGLDLISLVDNGHGMRFDDLPLAFSRHATSKISRFEDLYHLHSYGFRGEALASIASISKLQCISFVSGLSTGAEIRIDGGHTVLHEVRSKSGREHGTELVIQDLFYNTPARLKFIQSQNSEKQFIKKIVYSFILSNPTIEFQFKLNEADKEVYSAVETMQERLLQCFPRAGSQIQHSHRNYDNIDLTLFLLPGGLKGIGKCQNIHINGRLILDKQLHRVVANSLQLNHQDADYHYLALFKLPPDNIDVNVHPNKTIIKCLENPKLISLLSSTIRDLLSSAHKAPARASVGMSDPTQLLELAMQPATLQQERHEYNLEGNFSPHRLPAITDSSDFIWTGDFILIRREERWLAVSARRLLEAYLAKMLQTSAVSIPLMVSEPFAAAGVSSERLESLRAGGLELEFLGGETLVLRSIPEWMNGFPLKEIVSRLLQQKDFSTLGFGPADWSRSTWVEMLEAFPLSFLLEGKIILDLQQLLLEKLK